MKKIILWRCWGFPQGTLCSTIQAAFFWFFEKTDEIKCGDIRIRTQGIPYADGTFYHWATFSSILCPTIQAAFSWFFGKMFWKNEWNKILEILGFEPKAFPMRKGRSTTELHPLHSLLFCVPQFKLHFLGFFKKGFEKTVEIKCGDIGIRTQGLPYAKGTLYHWATSPTFNCSVSHNPSCILLVFWIRFWKTDEIKMEILEFEPKAFPMRKGRSTTELHPLCSLLICVQQFKLFSLGFLYIYIFIDSP